MHGDEVNPNLSQPSDDFSKNPAEKVLIQVRPEVSEVARRILGFGYVSPGVVGPGCPSALLAREGSGLCLSLE